MPDRQDLFRPEVNLDGEREKVFGTTFHHRRRRPRQPQHKDRVRGEVADAGNARTRLRWRFR